MDDAEIFATAVEIDDPAARDRYLDRACGPDSARRARVGELVRLHLEEPDPQFLVEPAPERIPDVRRALADALAAADDADDDADEDPLRGMCIDGIVLGRRIGAGAFGIVYEGRQAWPPRTVAVKVMRPRRARRDLVRRFEIEAQLLAQLDHPGIARIHAAGTLDLHGRRLPYLVMEYIAEARPLTTHAAGLPLRRRLELFQQVAAAVAQAHRRGVIHRDLKPANILVGSDGQPRVIDFGWGRSSRLPAARDSQQTMAGQLIGTSQYMSPEQFDGAPQAVDTRSDVYSLGVILHELLAGRPPYDVGSKGLFEVAAIVAHEEPPPLHRLDRRIPRDVSTIAAICLRKDRQDRYSSAHELAADLGRHLAGEAITASPPRAIDAIRRFARRHTLAAMALAAVVMSLAGAVVGVSIFAFEAERSRQAAETARQAEEQALRLAETRLTESGREAANARRQLYVANLYRLADLAAGSNAAAAAACFTDTLRDIGIEPAGRPFAAIPDLPFEMRCLWPLVDQCLIAAGGLFDGKPQGVSWSADGRFLAAGASTGSAYLVALDDPRRVERLGSGEATVAAVAFAAAGTRMATASAAGVEIRDTATRRVLATGSGPAADWHLVAFRPDGGQVAAAAADGTLALWDAATGSRVATPGRHTRPVTALAYSPDGRRLVSASLDCSVRIWDSAAGTRLHQLITARLKRFQAAAFSPDGSRVAAGDSGGGIRVWDVATGKPVRSREDPDGILALAWSPDGRWLATGDTAGVATVRDAANLELVARIAGHGRLLSSLAWSPDSRLLATASHDRTRTIGLWEATTGRPVRTFKGHADAVTSLAFSPDGALLASTGVDRTLRLWDTSTHPATVLTAAAPVVAVAVSLDGQRIACGTASGALVVRDARSLECVHAADVHAGAVTALAFLPDGSLLSGGADGRVCVHDSATGAPVADLPPHAGGVRAVAVLPDGRCVSAGTDGVARVCDGRTGRALATFNAGEGPVTALAVAIAAVPGADSETGAPADGTTGGAVTGGGVGGVVLLARFGRGVDGFSLATGQHLARVADETALVGRLAASPCGRYVATGALRGGGVTIVDAARGTVVAQCRGHTGSVNNLAFSADGTRLFSAGQDNHVRVWSVPDGRALADWGGHEDAVLALAESPRGDRLATGSADGTVRIWDVADGSQLAVLRGHTNRVRHVVFAPDGGWLVSMADDGTARVWGRSEAEVFAARRGRGE